jgi:predicted phosphate transport protein (TIGR00153 family)
MPGLLNRLLPREHAFFELFTAQAENVHQGAAALVALLENYKDVPVQVERIKTIEHTGDELTHDLLTRLNQTFITPFDREDIHNLSSKVDDVLDLTDAVASRLVTYNVHSVRPGFADLAKILLQSCDEVRQAVSRLELQDGMLEHCIEINRLENEGDRLSRTMIGQLFDEEKDPVELIKWKELVEVLETAIDKCEDVANVLEGVSLKNA